MATAHTAAKPYILQRQLDDDRRGLWFDDKAFDTADSAYKALQYERASQQFRIDGDGGSGFTGKRIQQMRIVQVTTT